MGCPRTLALLLMDAPPKIAGTSRARLPLGNPRSLLPHEVEIFVTRELRKAGLAPSAVKVRDRILTAGKTDDYTVELGCSLHVGDSDCYVLIECHNRPAPVSTAAIEALHTKVQHAKAHYAM